MTMTATSFSPLDAFTTRPYESPALRRITGPTLRPGGLALTRRAVAFCRLSIGARVLDLGCGPGASVAWLREQGYAASGLDRSGRLLGEARQDHPDLPVVRADATRLPFSGGIFDLVLAECVLSLLPAPERMLAECRRVLRPGAHLVVTDLYIVDEQALAPPDRPACGFPGGARGRKEMHALAARSGFDGVIWEDHSGHLRRLAADLVWTFGSLAPFRRHDPRQRLGFCLMICRKKDYAHG
jgi:arsenite methyltransferase